MKYASIDSQLFSDNRKRFAAEMQPQTVAIFNANDIMPSNADGHMGFSQNRDLFHLSGVDQEESILVLFPDAPRPELREILFLKETSPQIAIWEGAKLDKEQAQKCSGVQNIQWLTSFQKFHKEIMHECQGVYLNSNEHLRAHVEVETRDSRFIKQFKQEYPLHQLHRAAPIMHKIRSIKHSIEIDLMQEACDITEKGVRRLLNFIKPGVWEYEIEAELMHEFLRNRSRGFAYSPIIASGKSACVLHYVDNNAQCKDGDVILMDFGAEYANYASDLTRCFPVSGKFTKRQKEVYNAVLHVKDEASKILTPGTSLNEYHKEVGLIMEGQLLNLGLLDKTDIKNQNPDWPAYKKYFMHGTSHYIGLDVHDVGSWNKPISAGMIFTVEPGIYIPEENLGIRLEDDILITSKGFDNLMGSIPIKADEIEDLMNA